ncbi:extracellular solute-binding protein family 5 [Nitrosococcus halophilus Nc 4]|uniref:Extracellular solute-binding protein family 5 n=1 Tax=Nitrosococcus halophilus (strain Nc4) TaxID=472759 RepID=D5BXM0_NITHN|nr:ABC transporter substrate-binding protein [Nitrosococcus halophilus]ADE13978.1 extracellular solute-binding protein family 5 [Nitrosococcus halophilus Nc 4]
MLIAFLISPLLRWTGIFCLLWLTACTGEIWNNPYPHTEGAHNVAYSSFNLRPKTLDPARSYSANEVIFTGQIYEPPLQYHYLLRPYTLTPLTAESLPQVTYLDATGNLLPEEASAHEIAYSVYELRIRPGIYYQPHPALAKDDAGRLLYHNLTPGELEGIYKIGDFPRTGTRELVAADYVYQIKRLAHPKVHSPILGLMSHHIVGLKEYTQTLAAAQAGTQDEYLDLRAYPLAGVEVVDRYTYRLTIEGKYPQLRYWLAMPFFAPVPWEADRFYSQPGMAERNLNLDWYPVGTGPYMLTENDPNRRMVLERNPNFHGETYPTEGEPEDKTAGLLADGGEPLPFIDRVVFSLEKESIPYWNKFLQGYYDASEVASDSFDQALRISGGGELSLTAQMEAKGIKLVTAIGTSTYYVGFNMLDPVVGGYSERARKLRQAISIAIDYEEFISIFANGRGIAAQGPLPPGIFGYESGEKGINPYVYEWEKGQPRRKSLQTARRLLTEAGYPNGRDAETGKPLLLHFDTTSRGPDSAALLSWMRKQFRKLNIQLVVRDTDYNRFQDKMRQGNAQIFQWGWNADYPDPENFLFLLYGPEGKAKHGGENAANYSNPEFNRLFGQMKSMENGPERLMIIREMVAIARQDAPWVWGYHPKQVNLLHAWNSNVKPNLMANNTLKYRRIDPQLRAQLRAEWNRPVIWPLWALLAALVLVAMPAVMLYWRKERQPGRVVLEEH